jgi:NitT/TauT family transport system substrate-binding protein
MRSARTSIAAASLAAILAVAACTPAASPQPSPSAAASPSGAAASPSAAASAQPSPSPALTTVRYGLPTAPPAITTVGVYYALENGFFEEEGLQVEVVPYPGSTTATRALLSRDADIVMTGGDSAYLAWQNGAPIKIISSPVSKGTDVLVANAPIATVADLAGKRFAISDPGSSAEVLGKIILERNGVDPDGLEFVSIGSPPDRIRAMLAGQVDVTAATILILEPILQAIEAGQATVLTSFAEEFPDIPLAYNITRDDVIEEQRDMLVRFLRAEIRGYEWATENPAEAAAIAAANIPESDPELMVQGMEGLVELDVFGLDGGIAGDQITKSQEALVETGRLRAVSEPADVSDPSIVEEALQGS